MCGRITARVNSREQTAYVNHKLFMRKWSAGEVPHYVWVADDVILQKIVVHILIRSSYITRSMMSRKERFPPPVTGWGIRFQGIRMHFNGPIIGKIDAYTGSSSSSCNINRKLKQNFLIIYCDCALSSISLAVNSITTISSAYFCCFFLQQLHNVCCFMFCLHKSRFFPSLCASSSFSNSNANRNTHVAEQN